ncbi:MAG: GNAT family N-acetyltransferase [Pseudomonadota bacterium]|nr:GNAT family N-acetyltransferase [Pseudomonadota bacterium]MEE3099908.1 GNAT family N-acetyltransferase [Pseudomonadota bacterium]
MSREPDSGGGASAPPFVIREAEAEDAPALSAIARAAYALYVPRLGFEPPPMRQDFPADIDAGRVWAAAWADGGGGASGLVGYVVARPEGADWMIENVARAPDGPRGLGRALVAFAEAEGRARGFGRVVLYTNAAMTENQALYPRLGYVETGRREENGLSRVYYAKDL